MKSITLSVIFALILTTPLKAQSGSLQLKSSSKGLYVDHKVTAKENFYSIGRAFNVHPKHIASFNSLDMSKGLSLGQTIKIPLSDTNFNRKSDNGVPVYYLAGDNESLYKVSTNNNVLMEKLKKWNNLKNDKVAPGSKLIVGFLMNSETQALAVNDTQKNEPVNKPAQNPVKDVVKNDVVNKVEPKKEDAKKQESKKNNDSVSEKGETKIEELGSGYFKSSFEQQVKQQPVSKEQTVTSGIFKTSSGWSDAKYYLLMDGVEPGTIVRITNPNNHRTVYAKLLGEMSGLKQNEGLNIRISNAAADALQIPDADKFIVKLNY